MRAKMLISILVCLICGLIQVDCFKVCQSVTLQGPIQPNDNFLNDIQECSIIVGHVRILNAQFENETEIFTNLIEVTDYILIFQASNIRSLERLFPKLSIIRGDRLFKNYALIVFLCTSLVNLNLKSLVSIQRGSVFVSRLYHTCYINTIDWTAIVNDTSAAKPLIQLTNNDCYTEKCSSQCTIDGTTRCWSERNCQIQCPLECKHNCNIESGTCCENPKCVYCTSGECVSCAKYRDLTDGQCVDECPNGTLQYETHSCIRYEDCAFKSSPLTRTYHVLNETMCVRECPNGYRDVLVTRSSLTFSVCQKCDGRICKKDCPHVYNIKTLSDLESIKDCVRVKQLFIELRTNISIDVLAENLQYLEEITDFLVIVRNRHLQSLSFLQSLRSINGEHLYENRFALFIHTNEVLRELWPYEQAQTRVINGTVKFFENPEFCFNEIAKFLGFVNMSLSDADVSYHFNGYRRLTCSTHKIELQFEMGATEITVRWIVKFSDRRRLKGFILSYVQAPGNMTFNENNIDYKHKCTVQTDSTTTFVHESDWSLVYIEFDERLIENDVLSKTVDVEPFRRYAVYVYADVTFGSLWDNKASYLTYENDRAISDIYYVHSLPAKPGRVFDLTYNSINSSQIRLKWNAPREPNGIITSYLIAYSLLDDYETFPDNIDVCQFVPDKKEYHAFSNDDSEDSEVARTAESSSEKPAKKTDKISDDDKTDAILVEDDIYNLAFRPSFSYLTRPNLVERTSKRSENVSRSASTVPKPRTSLTHELTGYNVTDSIMQILQSDFIQTNEPVFVFNVSNTSQNAVVTGLKHFSRYVIGVIACQNYTNGLIEYSREYTSKLGDSKQLYLSRFPISTYCSKPNLITVRTLPNERMNEINETRIVRQTSAVYFEWSKPRQLNGILYKYNLKFTNVKLNKTQGPLCHPQLDKLKMALNNIFLEEGQDYYVQVQAISTAGEGEWSSPLKYYAPTARYLEIFQGAISGFVTIAVVVVIFIYLWCRFHKKLKDQGYFTINTQYYYFKPDEWEVPRDRVKVLERIGSGCFGEVFKGKLMHKDGSTAVNCAIKLHGPDKRCRDKIILEASLMKRINAPHVIKFLGVVSVDDPIYLILEFMDQGDLRNYLHKHRPHQELCNDVLTTERFNKMAAEIADGMLWLSEHKYVHCDLAARNCLVSKTNIIKIADLGLCKDIYVNPEYRKKCKALLPIRWMAVESLTDGTFTTSSDVWSFGVVIWELCTYADHPYAGKDNEEVIKFVKNGGKLEIPPNSPSILATIMSKCMMHRPFDRIDFKGILNLLEPNLPAQFKLTSYYSNDFKFKKQQNTDTLSNIDLNVNTTVLLDNSNYANGVAKSNHEASIIEYDNNTSTFPLVDQD